MFTNRSGHNIWWRAGSPTSASCMQIAFTPLTRISPKGLMTAALPPLTVRNAVPALADPGPAGRALQGPADRSAQGRVPWRRRQVRACLVSVVPRRWRRVPPLGRPGGRWWLRCG